jgi:DNA-binding response OmpR family regulator
LKNATVLIACSDDRERERLAAALSAAGHACLSCADGQCVRLELRSVSPDLVITEVDLPGLDVYEFVQILEENACGRSVPLVVGRVGPGTDNGSEAPQRFHWMGRPASAADLVEIVRNRLVMEQKELISGHILVVDDDRELRELLARRLKMAGYTTTTAMDGEDGLSRMEKGTDLVLTDIDMPLLDGFGFLAQLRSVPQYAHIPVIVMTANAGRGQDAARGLQMGANDYVRKPFDWDELLARVHTQFRVRDAFRLAAEKQRELAIVELAGAAAHEINNPLAVAVARLELMREKLDASHEFYNEVTQLNDMMDRISGIVKRMGEVHRYQVRHYCGDVNILDLSGSQNP